MDRRGRLRRVAGLHWIALVMAACAGGSGGTSGAGGDASESCEADAAFCARMGTSCGAISGTDRCGKPRTVARCGGCAGAAICGGGGTPNVCGTPTEGSGYVREAAACAARPMGTGRVYYFCDCSGPGADPGCVPGDDRAAGTRADAPRRTLRAAREQAGELAAGETIAFCRGGSFPTGGGSGYGWSSGACTADAPCSVRDYDPPTFEAHQPPILVQALLPGQQVRGPWSASATYGRDDVITDASGTRQYVSLQDGNVGKEPPTPQNGYVNSQFWQAWTGTMFSFNRAAHANLDLLNLRLQGDGTGSAVSFYEGTTDIRACNLEIQDMDLAIYNESGGSAVNQRVDVRGCKIEGSRTIGYLGAAQDSELAYNLWDGNGGTNMFHHTIYVSAHEPVSGFRVVGNDIHGQYGPRCEGAPFVTHGALVDYRVEGNVVDIDPEAVTGGCWGIGVGAGGYAEAMYVRNGLFARNVIRNGGNQGMTLGECNGCLVENNVVVMDWTYGPTGNWGVNGIVVPGETARAGDDLTADVTLRNNTVWFGPRATGGGVGIVVGLEGTGYVVANNLVTSSGIDAAGVTCFDLSRPLSAFTYVDHNACGPSVGRWEKTRGALAAWQTYAAAQGLDAHSLMAAPQLTAPGTDFTPAAGSPLVDAADPAHAPSVDRTGRARDARPDVGALER